MPRREAYLYHHRMHHYILILILILMLKLERPQVMLPRSKAPNAGVRAFHFVPAHVGLLRLILYPPILLPDARRAALS